MNFHRFGKESETRVRRETCVGFERVQANERRGELLVLLSAFSIFVATKARGPIKDEKMKRRRERITGKKWRTGGTKEI